VTDVKEICELALRVPTPPLTAVEVVLRQRRRENRRRAGAVTVCAGLTVAAIAAVGLSVNRPDPADGTERGAVGASGSGAPSATRWSGGLPSDLRVTDAHGAAVQRLLTGAVPAGFAVEPNIVDEDATATRDLSTPRYPGPVYDSVTAIRLRQGDGVGLLAALTGYSGQDVPRAPLCSAAVYERLRSYPFKLDYRHLRGDRCERITVNGITVMVTIGEHRSMGEITSAVRFVPGGAVAITAYPGTVPFVDVDDLHEAISDHLASDIEEPLDRQPFTARQLAELLTDPGLLP
jgi:hypothetical protein